LSGYVREGLYRFRWLRAPVTGPFTIASKILLIGSSGVGLGSTLLSVKEVVLNVLVPYVKSMVKYMVSLGFNVIFIDEPILGVMVGKKKILLNYGDDEIVDAIEKVLGGVPGERGIHVCGKISSRLFEVLANTPSLNILNFEFHDSPENLRVVNSRLLEVGDKVLAPGIASSRTPVVEDVGELKSILDKVYRLAGGRVDLVSADCGFRGLKGVFSNDAEAYAVGIEKLRRVVTATKELLRSLR